MHIDLNILITRLVTYLKHNFFGRHTRNIFFRTKSAVNYKDKVYSDGECLHATTKYAA